MAATHMTTWKLVVTLSVLLSCLPRAHAHISVEMGGTHKARNADAGLKESPCGIKGSPRGANVYTYKPGATINVKLVETTIHPSYFRVAFDDDGDDGFVTPKGTDGAMGNCAGDPACGPGKEDYCNSPTVLLDNIEPHGGSFLDPNDITYTISVTLPKVECANCTLQIIQVMNDLNIHTQPYPADDVYYQCIDIVLSNSAPDVTDMPVSSKAMKCQEGGATAPTMTGAAGSAAPATTAGAAAPTMTAGAAGAAGAATSGTPPAASTTPAAGAKPTTPPATTPASTTRPPAMTAAAGSSATSAPATATMTQPVASAKPAEESGGCSAAGGDDSSLLAPALLLLTLLRRRKQ